MMCLVRPQNATVPNSPAAHQVAGTQPPVLGHDLGRGLGVVPVAPGARPGPGPTTPPSTPPGPRDLRGRPPGTCSRGVGNPPSRPCRPPSTAGRPWRRPRHRPRPCRSPRRTTPRRPLQHGQLEGRPHRLEPAGDVRRHDVRARHPHPHAREVALLRPGLQHHPEHRRHADERRGPTLLDGVEDLLGMEPSVDVGGESRGGQPDQCDETEDVRHRQSHHDLAGGQLGGEQRRGGHLTDEGGVAECRTLGVTGGSRRVEERRNIALLHPDLGKLRRLLATALGEDATVFQPLSTIVSILYSMGNRSKYSPLRSRPQMTWSISYSSGKVYSIQPFPGSLDIQLREFPYRPSFINCGSCLSGLILSPEVVTVVPNLASAILVPPRSNTSSSSIHGSRLLVARIVNRSRCDRTTSNRSTFFAGNTVAPVSRPSESSVLGLNLNGAGRAVPNRSTAAQFL